ncbi:MAG: hypothetical protein OEV42_21375, partial [Deltaproteobacteria bacterium]|nr:hypothetical protein [Deltaproteobacteria bacterium]
LTTSGGYLIVLDLTVPSFPQELGHAAPSDTYHAFRAAATESYNYTDSSGLTQVMDLAVTGSKTGGVHTVDLTNPYTPTPIGTVKNPDGTDFKAFASDIAISRNSGLAFITSGGAIYVIDIRDPFNPIMLNKIDAAPVGENGVIDELLGEVKALVEKDGWVYLASTDGGLRVLDLDPVLLKWLKAEGEIEGVSHKFAEDYYPALGGKTIILQGLNANNGPFKPGEVVKVRLKTVLANVDVKPLAGYECPGEELNFKCAKFIFDDKLGKNGASITKFVVTADKLTDMKETINLLFEIDMSSLSSKDRISNYMTGIPKEPVTLNVRHNGNVTWKEVLDGDAVFIFDKNGKRKGAYDETDTEDTRKVYYVNELFNQVLTRKRGVANYELLDEKSGFYDQKTADAVRMFKTNFGMNLVKSTINKKTVNIGNTAAVVNYDAGTKIFSYGSTDDTSPIFRKLMKDYGKRDKGESGSWLDKVIDKGLLVGAHNKLEDYLVNAAGNANNDTGLFELYNNVVVPFVDGMIAEGNTYKNYTGFFRSRSGTVEKGVSYSYGNHMKIDEFTTYKSVMVGAPSSYPICIPEYSNGYCGDNDFYNYRGNLVNNDPGNMYAGLKRHEYNKWMYRYFNLDGNNTFQFVPSEHYFYPLHWAGIDCSGFVQRVVNATENKLNKESLLPAVKTRLIDLADYDEYCDNLNCYRHRASNGTFANKDPVNATPAKYLTYYKTLPNDEAERNKVFIKLKKGDVLKYRNVHVSMVYDIDVSQCNANNCNYEIIHAYGVNCFKKERDKLTNQCKPGTFKRKVVVTPNNISGTLKTPTGFGRIKLWD